MTTLLLLRDGRRVEYPAPVERGDVLEFDETLYFVTAASIGTSRETGEPVTLATLSPVRP